MCAVSACTPNPNAHVFIPCLVRRAVEVSRTATGLPATYANLFHGVIHAEMPVQGADIPEPRGLQLWVDLPKQYKMVEPSYQELGPKECVVRPPVRGGVVSCLLACLQDPHRVP